MPFDYSGKILKKKENPNSTGIKQVIYLAKKDWFAAAGLKGLKTGAAIVAPGDSITVDGTHLFTTGKGFIRAEIPQDGQAMAELLGEVGGRNFGPKIEAFIPGNDKEVAEMMAHAKDDDWIVLVPLATGEHIQLGQEHMWAEVQPGWGSGQNSTGKNGWAITVQAYSGSMIYYEGAITEKPLLPIIESFAGAPLAAGGQNITISGFNFADVSSVKFGDTEATSFEVTDTLGWTEIVAVSPALAAGPYTIHVTNKYGTGDSATDINVV